MTSRVEITLRLFGAFREFAPDTGTLAVTLPCGSTVRELRPILAARLEAIRPERRAGALVATAALGSETEILSDDAILDGARELALLPPVCGGLR